jgi:hypothetical protein
MDNVLQRQQALREARENDQREKNDPGKKNAKEEGKESILKNKNPQNVAKSALKAVSAFSSAKPHDMVYFFAMMAAVLKDILDFIAITGIGYLFVLAFTFIISIFIFFMMLLGSFFDGSSGMKKQKHIKNYLVLLGGTTTEMIFGLNFLPITTFTVFLIYFMILKNRKENS